MEIFSIGFLAGLALAIPLGPMAVLLITTTIKKGRSVAVFGALAMASVDFLYALLVFALGDLVIQSIGAWVYPLRVLGSILLIWVAAQIFLSARKPIQELGEDKATRSTSVLTTYATFFGLTVINPATAFYFVGVTPSVSVISAGDGFGIDALIFALGVFIASVIWQNLLVIGAHQIAKAAGSGLKRNLQYLGACLILVLAIWLLIS